MNGKKISPNFFSLLCIHGFILFTITVLLAVGEGCTAPERSANSLRLEVKNVEQQEASRDNRITLDSLEKMFSNMRGAPWYRDGDLLWGYFFTDPDPEKLKAAAKKLEEAGYRVVDIYPTDDGSTYFLHVEKVETHTPQTLHDRNTEFYELAEEFELESYDGMDVGPVLSK